jgi:hypothetical protein
MWVLEPQGADERLDPQHGVQRQMSLPWSFVLTNTIPNPIKASISGGVLKKAPVLFLGPRRP